MSGRAPSEMREEGAAALAGPWRQWRLASGRVGGRNHFYSEEDEGGEEYGVVYSTSTSV